MPTKVLCFIWTITLAHGAGIEKRQSPGFPGLPGGLPMAAMEDPFEPAEMSDRVAPPAFFNQRFSNQQNGLFQNPFNQMMQQPNFRANAGGLYNNNNNNNLQAAMFGGGFMGQRAQFPQRLSPPPTANDMPAEYRLLYDMLTSWQNNQGLGSPGNLPRSARPQSPSAVQYRPVVPTRPQQAPRNPPPLPSGSPQIKRLQLTPAIAAIKSRGSNQPTQINQLGFQGVRSAPQPSLPGLSYNSARANFQNVASFIPARQSSPPVRYREPSRAFSQPVRVSPSVVAETHPPVMSNLLQTLRNQPSNRIIPQNVLAKLLADSVKSNGIRQMLSSIRNRRPSTQANVPSRQTTSQNNGLSRQLTTRGLTTNNVIPQTQVRNLQTGQVGVETLNRNLPTRAGTETMPPTGPNPNPTRAWTDVGSMRYDLQLSRSTPANLPFQQTFPQSSGGPTFSATKGGRGQTPPINAPVDSPRLTTVSINTPDPRQSSVLVIPGEKIGTVSAPL